jgi:hypothetical protein
MAVEILVGTDVQLLTPAPEGHGVCVPRYIPNLQVEARDAFLGGDIRVHSKERELSYTKNIDINGARARDDDVHVTADMALWAQA